MTKVVQIVLFLLIVLILSEFVSAKRGRGSKGGSIGGNIGSSYDRHTYDLNLDPIRSVLDYSLLRIGARRNPADSISGNLQRRKDPNMNPDSGKNYPAGNYDAKVPPKDDTEQIGSTDSTQTNENEKKTTATGDSYIADGSKPGYGIDGEMNLEGDKKFIVIDHDKTKADNKEKVEMLVLAPAAGAHTHMVLPVKTVPRTTNYHTHSTITPMRNHPQIVSLHGWYICGPDQLAIVTEYFEGGTLEDFIRKNAPIPWTVAFPLFKQICSAMCFLTKLGLVHRDLAPRNLMFADKSRLHLKLIDFGLCRRVGNLQTFIDHRRQLQKYQPLKKALPTIYTPPECFEAKRKFNRIKAEINSQKSADQQQDLLRSVAPKFNEKTDVWAFGVIVWQCLCPIQSMDTMIAERIHLKETGNLMPQTIRTLNSQAANIYKTLVKPCLSLDSVDRPTFAQISGMLDQINAYQELLVMNKINNWALRFIK